jgi:hypothetical protein
MFSVNTANQMMLGRGRQSSGENGDPFHAQILRLFCSCEPRLFCVLCLPVPPLSPGPGWGVFVSGSQAALTVSPDTGVTLFKVCFGPTVSSPESAQ